MNGFLWNLMLALCWALGTGDFTLANLVVGFALGFAVLVLTRRLAGAPRYGDRTVRAVALAGFFVWQLLLSNLRVAYEVLTPGHHMRPGVVAVPLDATTDAEITVLANLITLTPGTLSLDVSTDRRVLYVHSLYVGDPDEFRREIKDGFERRVLQVLR
jgi:multicomponent Na+:H+ antiporter subunit E